MEYIHIKNLEKYNPGYIDRTLIWCKVYFAMLNTNYEFDELDDMDKWRFIALVMLELQRKKPIPHDIDWIRKKISNHKKPIPLTLKMLHNFIEYVTEDGKPIVGKPDAIKKNPVTQNRVEENRIDKNKASPALTAALTKIYDKGKGISIYALIAKLKKQMGQPKTWQFPDEVLLGVCKAYEHDKAEIDKPWPWFIKVIKIETGLWNSQKEINLNNKDRGMPQSFKDILNSIK